MVGSHEARTSHAGSNTDVAGDGVMRPAAKKPETQLNGGVNPDPDSREPRTRGFSRRLSTAFACRAQGMWAGAWLFVLVMLRLYLLGQVTVKSRNARLRDKVAEGEPPDSLVIPAITH